MVSKDPNKRLGGLHFAVFYGERLEKTVTLAQDCIFIGRLLTSHLPVEDSKVSRMHAVIEIRDGNEVIVSDLESSNGTRLNGNPISTANLKNGDFVEIGDSRIKVEFLSPEELSTMPSVVYHSGISRGLGQQVGVDTVMLDTAMVSDKVEVSNEEIDRIISQLEPAVQRGTPIGKVRDIKAFDAASKTMVTKKPEAKTVSKTALVDTSSKIRARVSQNTTQVEQNEKARAALRMIHGTGTALEVKVQWGDEILDVLHLDRPTTITLGTHKKNNYIVPPNESYPYSVPMIAPMAEKGAEGGFMLGFTESMQGWVYTGEKLQSLKDLQKSPRLRAAKVGKQKIFHYPLSSSDKGMISIENMAFAFQTVRSFPEYKSPAIKKDRRPFFIGLALYAALITSSVFISVPESEPTVEEQVKETSAAYDVMYSRERARSIFENMVNQDIKDLGSRQGSELGKATVGDKQKGNLHDTRVGGAEGARTQSIPKAVGRPSNGPGGNENLAKALEALKSNDITRLLGGTSLGGIGATNAPSNVGSAPRVFANLGSSLKGNTNGAGGGGTGIGGGESVDIGGLGTKGKGSGSGGYGTVKLGQKMEALIDTGTDDEVNIRGALDKDLIRKVVERNKGQIQFCYDTKLQLRRGGKPSGRVMAFWRIAPSGRVVETRSISSTMQDAGFEQCLMDRIRTWIFPEPKGGGSVNVEYPFTFRPAG